MKPVVQQDKTGCGIACVAALAYVSYQTAKQAATRLGVDITDKALWSDQRPIRALLRHFKIRAAKRESPFKSWTSLPPLALLAVKWHKENQTPMWHWTVFVRDGKAACVLDSKKDLKSHVRTDFGRIGPKWFISLRP